MTGGNTSPEPMRAMLSRQVVLCWMAFFMAVGTYLRMQPPFYNYTYNNDEFILMGIVNARSFKELMHYALYDSHPPLYYLLAHYWGLISHSPPFMRSLQLIMGMAMVPLYYLIGRRVAGPLCGLCCAGLVTFSFGAIVQSYIMRQYCVLMLALSLNFYYYLCWRQDRKHSALAGYVITGWLAALSHFFSDFYFLSLVPFEAISLWRIRREQGLSRLAWWLAANAAIFVLIAVLYYFWEPTLSYYKHIDAWVRPPTEQFIVTMLIAPFYAAGYISPSPYPLLPFALLYVYFGMLPETFARLRPFLALGGIACVVCMLVYGAGLFSWLGTRHCTWIFPLLIVPMGAVLTDMIERWIAKAGHFPIRIILMLIVIAGVCDTGRRFIDEDYPDWQRGALQVLSAAMDTLGPRDVVITDKDGLNLLDTMQPYKTDENFMNSDTPALVPFRNAHMLIGQDYFGIFSPRAVRDMIEHAETSHLLDDIDRIVIVKMWNKWPFYYLVTCQSLPKQVILPAGEYVREQLYPQEFAVVAVSKKIFFENVMTSFGPASQCLNADQDTIPEWYYLPRTAKHSPH